VEVCAVVSNGELEIAHRNPELSVIEETSVQSAGGQALSRRPSDS
jgi:hypothetical protein